MPSREGGVEIVVEELSVRMANLGHDVTCINRRGHHVSGKQFDMAHTDQFQNIKIRTVPTLDIKGLAAVTSSFFAAVKAAFSDADVVHIHSEGPAIFCWLPKFFKKRVIVTVHGLDWRREKWKHGFGSKFIRWGEQAAVRFADEIIVLSEGVQRYFRDTYGRETVFIPNGVSRPETLDVCEIRDRWALEKNGYILFLGRLVPEKGVAYLIEAFRSVQTDKKLVIAGGSSDTDNYAQELKKLAAGDNRILFTGFVQGRMLEELYSSAYVYVLPSDLEGMPLSLLEAMSYGNCCVTSDIEECAAVTGEHGLTFPRGNIGTLRDLLQSLCDESLTVEDYRNKSRDYITRKYNWDDVANRTLELYQ